MTVDCHRAPRDKPGRIRPFKGLSPGKEDKYIEFTREGYDDVFTFEVLVAGVLSGFVQPGCLGAG